MSGEHSFDTTVCVKERFMGAIEEFFCVHIASSKNKVNWENARQLWKP